MIACGADGCRVLASHDCENHTDNVVYIGHDVADCISDDQLELEVGIVLALPSVFGEARDAGCAELGVSSASQARRLAFSASSLSLTFLQGPSCLAATADGVTDASCAVGVARGAGSILVDIVSVGADRALIGAEFITLEAVGEYWASCADASSSCRGPVVVEPVATIFAR